MNEKRKPSIIFSSKRRAQQAEHEQVVKQARALGHQLYNEREIQYFNDAALIDRVYANGFSDEDKINVWQGFKARRDTIYAVEERLIKAVDLKVNAMRPAFELLILFDRAMEAVLELGGADDGTIERLTTEFTVADRLETSQEDLLDRLSETRLIDIEDTGPTLAPFGGHITVGLQNLRAAKEPLGFRQMLSGIIHRGE